MGRGWMVVVLACAGLPATGCAQDRASPTPERTLPEEVRQPVAEMEALCSEFDAVPGDSPGLVTVVDLTGDGIDDYLFDSSAFVCRGGPAGLFGYGSGGADMEIYRGTQDGRAERVFHHGHFGVDIERTATPAQVVLGLQGAGCGQDTVVRAEYESCLRPLVWDAARQEFDFAPLSAVRPLEH